MKPQSKTRRTLARQTAELIARELFSYGPTKINRLVMELDYNPPLHGPGWCESAVVEQIENILNRKHVRGKKPLVKK